MFLQPKKVKYKKIRKGKLSKLEFKSNKLVFGNIGLKASESGIITARQIEACRQTISRKIKRKGKLWIRIFPDIPVLAKPTASRMGKGKGSISHWGVKVSGGTVLFEIFGIKDFKIVLSAFKSGGTKLPIKTRIFS